MKFTIVVHSAPYSSQGAQTALSFCQAALSEGHRIYRLFFFREGVHNLNSLAVTAQDEVNLQAQWQTLIDENKIDSVACVTSALKRGVLDQQEAARYDKSTFNLTDKTEIAGLGQLMDALLESDRVVNFG